MTIQTRSARLEEYPQIREILQEAFGDDEVQLWDHLVAHDPALTPDTIRVALDPRGRPVACTVVLPRTIQGPQGPVPAAVTTLVACRPELQRRGYGGATVRDGLRQMAERGLAFSILYGEADYYPRFGYARVLPLYRTILPVDTPELNQVPLPEADQPLRPATEADLPLLSGLFARHLAGYPGAVARGPEPWLWQLRKPERFALLLTRSGAPAYALVAEDREQGLLFVYEAAADEPAAGRLLLTGLLGEARRRGLAEVRLATPPDHLVTRLAVLHGAEQRLQPAKHGMVAVTRWAPLLPAGYTVSGGALLREGEPVLEAPEASLVQLAFGYRTVDDLLLLGEARLKGDPAVLRADFPARLPKWSLAPFWM
ncbi:MAG: GNAT family N-acetyltransferase [Bacillota bacterium]